MPEAGVSVIATMAHLLQSVSTEATEKEKELAVLQTDIKALLLKLQGAAVQQTDKGRGPKQLDWTGSGQAAVERAWKHTMARVTRRRKQKLYVIGHLRNLYKELDETFHAMSPSDMMACDMRLVGTHIMEKESQLEAVAQLDAAASEPDARDPALVHPDQSGWDKASVLRQDEAFFFVEECLVEDQIHILDVLEILRRMEKTLKTQERAKVRLSTLLASSSCTVARVCSFFFIDLIAWLFY